MHAESAVEMKRRAKKLEEKSKPGTLNTLHRQGRNNLRWSIDEGNEVLTEG